MPRKRTPPFSSPEVKAVFDRQTPKLKKKLLLLRKLIFAVAEDTEGVGALEETLKWGEASYLTSETKSGTTIRINSVKKQPEYYALYVNCQTDLISSFREIFADLFFFDGNRAIVFHQDDTLPEEPLRHCITEALTYHRNKK